MGPTGSVASEWAMKIQEVTLRAMAKRITCSQAAEIIGISDAADAETDSSLEGIIVL